MLNIGDKVPHFNFVDQDGNKDNSKNLENKKWVLFFYPKADTPTCTIEVCNIRDNYTNLINSGLLIYGISADDQRKQFKFKEKHELPFNLIADSDKSICKLFGVWGSKNFMGREYEGITRTTFIINEEGIIEKVISEVKAKNHAKQILEK
ncbi:MAG: thioredoxin-dependent thiol peroxidase [Solirubrobacteraceae bacterium]